MTTDIPTASRFVRSTGDAKESADLATIELRPGLRARVVAGALHVVGSGDRTPCVIGLAGWSAFLRGATCDLDSLSPRRVLKSSPDVEIVQTAVMDGPQVLPVVVKRYNEARRRGFRRWVSSSLARCDFRLLRTLRQRGIRVPCPLAYAGSTGLGRHSWIVTEFVEGLIDLEQILGSVLFRLPENERRAHKHATIAAVVDLFRSIDRAGLHQRDLKASNILIRHWDGDGGSPEAWIVDVEGFRGARWRAATRRRQRMVRLAASLHECPGVTRTDHARFLIAYGGHNGGTREQWRSSFRALAGAARRYLRASTRRKRHKIDGYGG